VEEALVRRFIATVNQRDLDALDALVAPEYRHLAPGQPLTLAELKGVLGELFAGFPDLASTIDTVEEDGDGVVVWWTGRGTHGGAFMGTAPTGREIRIDGCNRFEVRDGRIVRDEPRWSLADLLAQIR
jgi:steroid delta-isomerase-like uncharacterized protein